VIWSNSKRDIACESCLDEARLVDKRLAEAYLDRLETIYRKALEKDKETSLRNIILILNI
jgi:hypothetical protein